MKKDSKIYIAGHRGLVGSAILRNLEAKGYTNFVLRTHAELDLERQAAVETFFEKERPEYVFLAAAKVGGIMANNTYPADFIYNNLLIQVNVINAAHKYGVNRLLFLGSSCIYPKFAPQPMKEEHLLTGELEPTNEPYAIAKIAGIKLCESYNRQYGTQFVSVMPTNLYGPNDNFDLQSSHVLPAMIRKFHEAKLRMEQAKGKTGNKEEVKVKAENKTEIKVKTQVKAADNNEIEAKAKVKELPHSKSEPAVASSSQFNSQPQSDDHKVVLWGTGSPKREFLHVDDMADACTFIMNLPNDELKKHFLEYGEPSFVNVGTGVDVTIKELAETVCEVVGFEGEIVWDSTKPDGTPRKLLDVSRLEEIGWAAKVPLEKGVAAAYEWYLQHAETIRK